MLLLLLLLLLHSWRGGRPCLRWNEWRRRSPLYRRRFGRRRFRVIPMAATFASTATFATLNSFATRTSASASAPNQTVERSLVVDFSRLRELPVQFHCLARLNEAPSAGKKIRWGLDVCFMKFSYMPAPLSFLPTSSLKLMTMNTARPL